MLNAAQSVGLGELLAEIGLSTDGFPTHWGDGCCTVATSRPAFQPEETVASHRCLHEEQMILCSIAQARVQLFKSAGVKVDSPYKLDALTGAGKAFTLSELEEGDEDEVVPFLFLLDEIEDGRKTRH